MVERRPSVLLFQRYVTASAAARALWRLSDTKALRFLALVMFYSLSPAARASS